VVNDYNSRIMSAISSACGLMVAVFGYFKQLDNDFVMFFDRPSNAIDGATRRFHICPAKTKATNEG
jgi:hypothetical protein